MMEVSNSCFTVNYNWDSGYLKSICEVDFHDCLDLWVSNISDMELVNAVNDMEKYSPIVEDISPDDTKLCPAVEKIEEE